MNFKFARIFAQPIVRALLAITVVGAAATLMGRKAETKATRIGLAADKTRGADVTR
jgi:hypothetical protein